MSEQHPIISPYLSWYVYFSNYDGQQPAREWGERLAAHLGVPLHTDYDDIDASQHICYLYPLPDTWVLYVSVDMQGPQPLTAWQELSSTLFGQDRQLWQALYQQIREASPQTPSRHFWGSTLLFGAEPSSASFDAEQWQGLMPLLLGWGNQVRLKRSVEPWGNVWQLTGLYDDFIETAHIYAVLTESDSQASYFFEFGKLDQLELSLHKAYHHINQHRIGRKRLYSLMPELDAQLKKLLDKAIPTQQSLSTLSKQYLNYVDWISQVAQLRQTVAINSDNYRYIAEEFRLLRQTDEIFKDHSQKLKRGMAQLDADRVYYEAGQRRLDTGLQTLRAELELQLVTAQHKAAEEREQARQEREREREKAQKRAEAEREAREKENERQEERENERNQLLTWIGIGLGLTQLWPITERILESFDFSVETQFYIDSMFLIVPVVIMIVFAVVWFGKRT